MNERKKQVGHLPSSGDNDDFLLREGFDLIAAFRAIQSEEARKAVIKMIAAIVQAESDARHHPDA